MRIAFFTTRMVLGYGVDLTIHELARRLVARGHSVDVWTPTSDGTYAHEAYRLREVIVYGERQNRVLALLERNARIALRKLAEQLAADGTAYDVVVPCTHPYYAAGQVFGVPQVFFNFGNVPTAGFSWRGRLNWMWLDISEQLWLKPDSARVVSISRFLHEQQSLEVRNKGRVVPLGGDHYYPWSDPAVGGGLAPPRSHAAGMAERRSQEVPDGQRLSGGRVQDLPLRPQLRSAFHASLGIPPEAVVIGYCGRLHRDHPRYKGLTELLEIGRRIRSLQPGVELFCAGIGSDADRAWVESYGARALLNLPPAQMPAFYSALDIYATASRWEGFDLPILEAAWHGVPAVAYNVGAHGEHVTAVLVHDVRADELGRALLTLVRDAKLRRAFSADVFRRARQFSWERSCDLFEAVLREVARGETYTGEVAQ